MARKQPRSEKEVKRGVVTDFIRDLARGVVGLFRRRTTPAPRPPRKPLHGGHRGIAAGSLKPGMQDFSPENIAKWERTSADEVESFVYDGEWFSVHSSNVQALQYNNDKKELLVKFKPKGRNPGGLYKYENVTTEEAVQFAQAQSKGGACWDMLRVRGTKYGHKKPYSRVR